MHPKSVAVIGSSAFDGCEGIKEVFLPNIEKIESGAFISCKSIETVTVGKNASRIEAYAFSGCSSIKDFYCFAEIPPCSTYERETIFDQEVKDNGTLHVPASAVDTYRSTMPWREFCNIVAITSEEASIQSVWPTDENCRYFRIDGTEVDQTSKGIQIKRYPNGRTSKVFNK